jgi:hypothetical protein
VSGRTGPPHPRCAPLPAWCCTRCHGCTQSAGEMPTRRSRAAVIPCSESRLLPWLHSASKMPVPDLRAAASPARSRASCRGCVSSVGEMPASDLRAATSSMRRRQPPCRRELHASPLTFAPQPTSAPPQASCAATDLRAGIELHNDKPPFVQRAR